MKQTYNYSTLSTINMETTISLLIASLKKAIKIHTQMVIGRFLAVHAQFSSGNLYSNYSYPTSTPGRVPVAIFADKP